MKTGDTKRTAIVTGANRGLGLEVCRQLARLNHRVILTSRNEAKGRAAVEKLQPAGGEILFHQLDVSDPGSIVRFTFFWKDAERWEGTDFVVAIEKSSSV